VRRGSFRFAGISGRAPAHYGIDSPMRALIVCVRCERGRGVAPADRRRSIMPEKRTLERARKARRAGKAPSSQAGEFVREEIRKIRRGEHGARSARQAVAIGLSKARRAGVPPPPAKGEGAHAAERALRLRGGPAQAQDPPAAAPRARCRAGPRARAAQRGVAPGVVAPGEERGRAPQRRRTLRRRTQGGAHQGPHRPLGRGPQGRAHPRTPFALARL
jgi:hypothetical protein